MMLPTLVPPPPPTLDPRRLALAGMSVRLLAVADGDTISIQGTQLITMMDRIRLLGIDAPERGEQGWSHSREHLASLIRGQELRLEGAHGPELTRGRCNRILAWLWAGDVLVQYGQVLSGWARSAHDWGEGYYTGLLDQAAEWARNAGMPRAPIRLDRQ